MKRMLLKSYYKILLLASLCCTSLWLNAQEGVYVSSSRPSSYLGLSIAGGEANRIATKTSPVNNQSGWVADISCYYEFHHRSWLWGIGLGLAFDNVNDTVATFTDSFLRNDIDGEMVDYQYVYTSYRERQRMMNVTIPIYVGVNINHIYAILGARIDIPMETRYDVDATMYTQGVYPWSITPVASKGINDFSSLGFYREQPYTYSNEYEGYMHITPFAEVGYEFLTTSKINMRAGAYVAYAIPVIKSEKVALADYSAVNTNPHTQTLENLKEKISWNPLALSDKYTSLPYKLEVGVKLSVQFNVTVRGGKCMCEE